MGPLLRVAKVPTIPLSLPGRQISLLPGSLPRVVRPGAGGAGGERDLICPIEMALSQLRMLGLMAFWSVKHWGLILEYGGGGEEGK